MIKHTQDSTSSISQPQSVETELEVTNPTATIEVDLFTKTTFDPHRPQPSNLTPDRTVYMQAARTLLPRWLKRMGSAPWLSDDYRSVQLRHTHPKELYQHQAATLGIALLCHMDHDIKDADYLHECIRTSLIRWQLSLRSDGIPVSSKWRRSLWYGAAVFQVIQLLRENTDFQNPQLMKDIEFHIQWLSYRRASTPWLEACNIAAIAESATLMSDAKSLKLAHLRLDRLLKRQNSEGWFPERGGVDIGRHSVTIDALARLYRIHGWEELEEPLRKAVGFLHPFVLPNASAGGCIGSCNTSFICPYGLELLAFRFSQAAQIATYYRQHLNNVDLHLLTNWSDELCFTLGTNLALCATHAPPALPENETPPTEHPAHIYFPNAGLSIHNTDHYYAMVAGHKGGCCRVWWKKTGKITEDQGITVTYEQDVRVSSRNDPRITLTVSQSTVFCSGILRRMKRIRIHWNQWLRHFALRLMSIYRSQRTCRGTKPVASASRRIAPKRFERKISFGADWIRIEDKIHCLPKCEFIICQSPPGIHPSPLNDHHESYQHLPPIFMEGGRNVSLTRLYRDGQLVGQRDVPLEPQPSKNASQDEDKPAN